MTIITRAINPSIKASRLSCNGSPNVSAGRGVEDGNRAKKASHKTDVSFRARQIRCFVGPDPQGFNPPGDGLGKQLPVQCRNSFSAVCVSRGDRSTFKSSGGGKCKQAQVGDELAATACAALRLCPSPALLGRRKHWEARGSSSCNDQTVSNVLHVNNSSQYYRTALM